MLARLSNLLTVVSLLIAMTLSTSSAGQEVRREAADEQTAIQTSLSMLYDGLLAEDADVIRALIFVDHDPDGAIAAAQVQRLVANMRFLRAVAKFDVPHGENPFADAHVFLADEFAFGLLTGEWNIKGDRATMPPEERMGGPDHPERPPVIRVRGIWKLNLTPAQRPASPKELASAISRYARVLEQTATDVKAGKLKTVAEVRRSLEKPAALISGGTIPDVILGLTERGARALAAPEDLDLPFVRPTQN